MECNFCNGTGKKDGMECSKCRGIGKWICPMCNGTGKSEDGKRACWACAGT